MIRVTIDLHPGGDADRATTLHVIDIYNEVGTTRRTMGQYGDYGYRISRKLINGVLPPKPVWAKTGQIKHFPRSRKNAVHLLAAVLKDALGSK